jgi:hypothetical protein
MKKKKKQMFAYGAFVNDQLCFVGMSRKWDLTTAKGFPAVPAETKVVRLPEIDLINTELGYVERREYLAEKGTL